MGNLRDAADLGDRKLDAGTWAHAEIHRLHNQGEIEEFFAQIELARS